MISFLKDEKNQNNTYFKKHSFLIFKRNVKKKKKVDNFYFKVTMTYRPKYKLSRCKTIAVVINNINILNS